MIIERLTREDEEVILYGKNQVNPKSITGSCLVRGSLETASGNAWTETICDLAEKCNGAKNGPRFKRLCSQHKRALLRCQYVVEDFDPILPAHLLGSDIGGHK